MGDAKRDMHEIRGVLLGRLGRYPEALAEFASEEQLFPGNSGLYECRGKLYFRLGRYAENQADTTPARSSSPRRSPTPTTIAASASRFGAHRGGDRRLHASDRVRRRRWRPPIGIAVFRKPPSATSIKRSPIMMQGAALEP